MCTLLHAMFLISGLDTIYSFPAPNYELSFQVGVLFVMIRGISCHLKIVPKEGIPKVASDNYHSRLKTLIFVYQYQTQTR